MGKGVMADRFLEAAVSSGSVVRTVVRGSVFTRPVSQGNLDAVWLALDTNQNSTVTASLPPSSHFCCGSDFPVV